MMCLKSNTTGTDESGPMKLTQFNRIISRDLQLLLIHSSPFISSVVRLALESKLQE